MDQNGLRELIGKAIIDKDFRALLFSDRAAATQGYTLSAEDEATLDGITPEQFEQVASGEIEGEAICYYDPPPMPPKPTG